jgi:glutathionyl-hydroquinone reductase
MSNPIELPSAIDKEFTEFVEASKARLLAHLRDEMDEVMSKVYTDYAPHIETDAWTNYREYIWKELEGGLYKTVTDSEAGHRAKQIRAMIFQEHKDALVAALNQDLLKQISDLKQELALAYSRRT